MLTRSTKYWSVALLCACIIAFPLLVSATHSWNGFHWARTGNPFTLKLGTNITSAWTQAVNNASVDWSQSTVLNTTLVAGSVSPRTCKATAGMVQVCNATYGNTGWLGVAQVSVNGTHITAGTVKLNDTYFNTATYNKPSWRNMVACQEIGHTLGLNHQDTNFNNVNLGTCMDYTNDPTGTAGTNGTLDNENPNQHDYDELVTIYSHLDSSATLSATPAPPAMQAIELAGPEQWGPAIRGSRESGFSVHELDFGGGHKVFTFVTWARPDAH